MNYQEISELRRKHSISQTKLAEKSGYSKAKISAWELGKLIPSETEVDALFDSLRTMITDIESGKLDVKKKRIRHSGRDVSNLPSPIRDSNDYRTRLAAREATSPTNFSLLLSSLFAEATSPRKANSPKAIALFSGCGGMSLGFAAEGVDLVGHVEIEDSANKIYAENFPNSPLLGTDISTVSDEEINGWIEKFGQIDIIVGGPPCQGFSLAGKRDPNDARNYLYKNYAHIVSLIRPKVFVIENVRLLTSMKNKDGNLFINEISEEFHSLGYSISVAELNAADYGLPQSRERVMLVGVRNDLGKTFTFPAQTHSVSVQEDLFSSTEPYRTFREATEDLLFLEAGQSSTDPLHWTINHPEHVIHWLKNVPEGASAHDNEDPSLRPPSGFNTTYKRIRWDEPCSTISTNFSMISGCRNVHPTSTRSLTIREATRAQTFPDEFVFVGNWGSIRKAIGNAVPPLLAKAIASAVVNQIF